MDLSKQVISLEQAKRLEELGVAQDTSYFAFQGDTEYEPDLKSDDGKNYAAFTASEIWEMIPTLSLVSYKSKAGDDKYLYWIFSTDLLYSGPFFHSEAEARAALLIHLLSTHLLTADEANKRLGQ